MRFNSQRGVLYFQMIKMLKNGEKYGSDGCKINERILEEPDVNVG